MLPELNQEEDMRHRRPSIPVHRRAPSGMFRHAARDPRNELGWVVEDYSLEQLERLFEKEPGANVFDENGKRVGPDGEPLGFAN